MISNMFDLLGKARHLVLVENRPDDAYNAIREGVLERPDPFALNFIAEWIRHLAQEEEEVRSKFAEIVLFLKEEFPALEGLTQAKPFFEPFIQKASEPEPQSAPTPPSAESADEAEEQPETDEVHVEQGAEETAETEETPVTVTPEITTVTSEPEEADVAPVAQETEAPAKVAPRANTTDREYLTLTFYDWQMHAIERAAQKEKLEDTELIARILESGNTRPLSWSRYKNSPSSPNKRLTISVPCGTKEAIDKGKDMEGVKTTTKYVRRMLFGQRAEKY